MRRNVSCSKLVSTALAGASTLFSATLVNFTALTQPACADQASGDQLQEVVVTAERRKSFAQKTAASLSVRSGDDLLQEGRFSLPQILEDVPSIAGSLGNTNSIGYDQAGNSIVIRGIQSNTPPGGTVMSAASSTAVYVDGVYEGIGGDYDIARLEVLRGPQGTLYGRSATAGVVAIYTRDPELGHLGGNAAVELGDYGLQHYTAALNLPLGDEWAVRVAGNEYKRDGYLSKDGGAVKTTDARAKVLFQPNDSFSALVGVALQDNTLHSGGLSASLSSPDSTYSYSPIPVSGGTNDFRQYWARVRWDLGFATLTYTPSLRTWVQNAANTLICCGGLTIQAPAVTPYDHFDTQELHITSDPGSKLTWQAGATYFHSSVRNDSAVEFLNFGVLANSASTRKDTKDVGLFGEATYPLGAAWRVVGGARYDLTKVDVDQLYTANTNPMLVPEILVSTLISGEAGRREFHDATYKIRIEHDLTRSNLVYATVATGFTPGDVQAAVGTNLQPTVMSFKDELLTSYEIGSKNRFLDERLQVNGDVFFSNYGGFQTAGINLSGIATSPGFATIVVPERTKGVEVELEYQLTADDRLSLSYAYVDARYHDMPREFTQNVGTEHPWNVPPGTGSAAYQHTFRLPGGSVLNLRADARYTSAYDANVLAVSPVEVQLGAGQWIRDDSEVVGDLDGTWLSSDGHYSVTAYVRNIGDNRYKTYVSSLGVDTSTAPPSLIGFTAIPYDPRTWGVVLGVTF